jgi:serine/threonine-protein kinase
MSREDLPPGSSLGGFEIVRILGRGAMGAVYEARGPAGPVALKVILGDDADDLVFRERFRREATAGSSVVHPGVVRCVGFSEKGTNPWLALELVTGGSLADRLKRGPVPWPEAAAIGAQVARALAAIHAVGLVHRDLKPANVLLDGEGRPKLTDFGVARNTISQGHALTKTGETLGTPEYLAPEQVDSAKTVDGRADLYSLGMMLYALVAGDPPFRGALYAVLKMQLATTPPRLRSVAPATPPSLDALVARLVAKDPETRGVNAAAVALELEAIAKGETATPRRALAGLGAAGAIALALGGVFLATRRGEPPPELPPPPPPPPRVAPPAGPPPPPKWYRSLPEDQRPPLPLPAAIRFGGDKENGVYVSAVDPSLKLVFVPGGDFLMGDDDTNQDPTVKPQHTVRLSPYFLGKYEVRNDQFARYVATLSGPLERAKEYRHRRNKDVNNGRSWDHPYVGLNPEQTLSLRPDHPVVQVTPGNALGYAEWLGLELPTEAQWERAATWDARTRTKRPFAWGETIPSDDSGPLANLPKATVFQGYTFGKPDDLALPSAGGDFVRDRSTVDAYDMTGNVAEICRDRYDPDAYGRDDLRGPDPCRGPIPGSPDDERVVRGFSFGSPFSGTLNLTRREKWEYASDTIGFRVALTCR